MRKSCGNCKYFRNIGYKNWGDCCAPIPLWAEGRNMVWTDGCNSDYGEDCELYEHNRKQKLEKLLNAN